MKLQTALELVRKEMEEALTQEANMGRKTVLWKVGGLRPGELQAPPSS